MPGIRRHIRPTRGNGSHSRTNWFSRRKIAMLVALAVIPWGAASVGRAPERAIASTA